MPEEQKATELFELVELANDVGRRGFLEYPGIVGVEGTLTLARVASGNDTQGETQVVPPATGKKPSVAGSPIGRYVNDLIDMHAGVVSQEPKACRDFVVSATMKTATWSSVSSSPVTGLSVRRVTTS